MKGSCYYFPIDIHRKVTVIKVRPFQIIVSIMWWWNSSSENWENMESQDSASC